MKKVALSLYDESGNMLRDWARHGFTVYCVDILNKENSEEIGEGVIHYVNANMRDPATHKACIDLQPLFISAFPPCDDLAVSGTRHWEAKLERNPNYVQEAMDLVYAARDIGEAVNCPWFFENPVSRISSEWRKPDYYFHPFEYGGYLPLDDVHPRWPEYIAPRDAYSKKTCLWANDKFVMPWKKPVPYENVVYDNGVTGSVQFARLGGKSAKTKQIRSETARGFARAVFEWNCLHKQFD